jgi:curved DNA-binding protein CbpA
MTVTPVTGLYDVLGVAPDARLDELQAAYRRKAKTEHPDAGGDLERFAQLSSAIAVLRDPKRREEYDRTGKTETTDNAHVAVAEILAGAFQEALAGFPDPARFDVIGQTKAVLKDRMAQVKASRSQAQGEERKFTRALKRLSHKPGRQDILTSLLNQSLDQVTQHITKMDDMLATIETAIAYAGDYSWEVDAAPMQSTFGGGGMPGWTGSYTQL